MLPDYITHHLSNRQICPNPVGLDDPLTTWADLGMHDGARDLTRQEIAMLIEDATGRDIADSQLEAWNTLGDVAEVCG